MATDKLLLKKLAELTEAVNKVTSKEHISSTTIVPQSTQSHPGDHDLLLKIDTKVERVIVDVQKLSDNFAHRIDLLETDKVSKSDYEKIQTDYENRMRITEKFQDNLIGKMSIITIIISFIVAFIAAWLKSAFGI